MFHPSKCSGNEDSVQIPSEISCHIQATRSPPNSALTSKIATMASLPASSRIKFERSFKFDAHIAHKPETSPTLRSLPTVNRPNRLETLYCRREMTSITKEFYDHRLRRLHLQSELKNQRVKPFMLRDRTRRMNLKKGRCECE